ncbi:HAMP domain-containing histidine kinase [Bacteroidales bacterium OttesenSCG-928-L03]|nr:HAMP domain-containing histidine kinase [Bacteroidales bacterium OttesenSCG-928-L03]
MNLLYRITLRVSLALLVLFAVWGTVFYYIVIAEINDETDDSLEDYSEYIITRALAGEQLPEEDNGTNNSYYLVEVSAEYARTTPNIRYLDESVYIQSKKETEPSRIYKTIFKDKAGRFFELTVMIPTIEKQDLKETILFWIIALYVLLLLAILIVNAIVLRQSLKPLYIILDWIDGLNVDKEPAPLEVKADITEFGKLSEALMRSAHRNAEIYEQQSLFIGHASHELQTPIAIVRNRLEILADEPNLTEAQLVEIIKAQNTLEDLSKLNKTLLLLTKIENKHFPDTQEVDVNSLLRSLLADFSEANGHLSIEQSLDETCQLRLQMNETLASVLFSNLIKNAYIHNHSGGKVIISINSREVSFRNTGLPEALNPDYIFKRFYQGNKREGSAGLGLSLVESIAKRYGIEIRYRYDAGMHGFSLIAREE